MRLFYAQGERLKLRFCGFWVWVRPLRVVGAGGSVFDNGLECEVCEYSSSVSRMLTMLV